MESFYWFILTILLAPIAIGIIAVLSYMCQYHWSHPKHHWHLSDW